MTADQARQAIRAKIDASSYKFQNNELRQALGKKDTLLRDMTWERDWYKRGVEQDAVISAKQQKRIARQEKELWAWRSGLVAALIKIFAK